MNTLKIFCLSLGMSLVGLASCRHEALVVNNTQSDPQVEEWDGVVYPSSKNYMPMTRGLLSQFETEWENMDEINYPDGGKFLLPWNSTEPTSGNLPTAFAYDVKKEDGWKMLFHTMTDNSDPKKYIGLYNQRTGVLKVFYYLEPSLDSPNNTGEWQIYFDANSAYLNHTGELAIPNNLQSPELWKCTTTSMLGIKPFAGEWNGFQIPLAYVPNLDMAYKMFINTMCYNVGVLDIFGTNYSYSSGTILTYENAPVSGSTSNMATISGKSAEEYIDDEIAAHNFKEQADATDTRGVVGDLITKALKYGVNKVFSKFTSAFSQPTVTRSDLEFSTKGIVELQGNFSQPTQGSILSASLFFDKDHIGEVGVWNLAEQPTIYMDPRADYVPNPPYDEMYHEYNYQLRGVSRYEYDLLINPELEPYIKDQWVEIDLIRYWDYEHCADVPEVPEMYSFGSLGGRQNGFEGNTYKEEDLIYGEHLATGAIYREPMAYTIYTKYGKGLDGEYRDPEPTVYVLNTPTYTYQKFNSENIFMKVSLYLVTEFEGKEETTISTRTFIPKIEWDPVICEQMEKMEQLKKQKQLEEDGMSEEEPEGDAPEEELAEEELPLGDDLN